MGLFEKGRVDLIEHVFHSTREAPPIGQDHEGQFLPVEVVDGLCCFEGRVGEPDLKLLFHEHASSLNS